MILVDRYDSFMPSVTIKDAEGRYIESGFTTDCNGEDCDGTAVMVKALSPGMYTVQMTASGRGGEFKVDMMCSNDLVGDEGTVCSKLLTQFIAIWWIHHLLCLPKYHSISQ